MYQMWKWGNSWNKRNREKVREYSYNSYRRNVDRVKEYHKKYYKENKERILKRQKEYYKNNTEKVKEWKRKWVLNNQDEIKKLNHNWSIRNRDKGRKSAQKRIALKRNLPHIDYDFESICKFYNDICLCCSKNKKLEIDHIVPISWDDCPGDVPSNIQPLCITCNRRKGNRHSTDYRWDKGVEMLKFLKIRQTTLTEDNPKTL